MSDPPPHPLEYRVTKTSRGPASGQVLLGFFAWLATLALTAGFGGVANALYSGRTFLAVAIALPVLGAIGLGVWLRVRHGWRGFLPGLLLGFGLTCLLPFGVITVLGRVLR